MDIKAFIIKSKVADIPNEMIFDMISEAVLSAKDVLISEVNSGSVTIEAAINNGLDVVYDNYMES